MKKEKLKLALWGVIGLLLLVLVYATFFTGEVTASTSVASSGMVGGC